MTTLNYDANTAISDVTFSIYDTETTGGNKNRKDYPVEVAVVKLSFSEGVFGLQSWLVKPPIKIHPAAIAVHGILDKELEDKPVLEDVIGEIEACVRNTVLCAHNDAFDLEMLPSFKEMPEFKIDTLKLAKKVYKVGELNSDGQDLSSMKLQEIRYWLGLDVDTNGLPAHRAPADVLVAAEVMVDMLNRAMEISNAYTIGELIEFINTPNIIEVIPFGKLKGQNTRQAMVAEAMTGRSWFDWLLRSETPENPIDPDFKYTILTLKKELRV